MRYYILTTLFIHFLPYYVLSQIKLDFENTQYLSEDINCIKGQFIENDNNYNSIYFKEKVIRFNQDYHLGSNLLAMSHDKKTLVSLSNNGEVNIFDLSNGMLVKNISSKRVFQQISTPNYKLSQTNNTFFNSISLTKNGEYLVIEMFDFSELNNYSNYLVLDLYSDKNEIVDLLSFKNKSILDEKFINSQTQKNISENTINIIKNKIDGELSVIKLEDGCYFTGENNIPLEFIELSDPEVANKIISKINKEVEDRFDFYGEISKSNFEKLINHEYLLKGVFSHNDKDYALFGNSYGQKNCFFTAYCLNGLYDSYEVIESKVKNDIDEWAKKVLSDEKNFLNIAHKDLYLTYNNGYKLFSKKFLQKSPLIDKNFYSNIWNNSYKWYSYLSLPALTNITKDNSAIFKLGKNGPYILIENINNLIIVKSLELNYDFHDDVITPQNIELKILNLKSLNKKSLLPKHENKTTLLSTIPSKILGIEGCSMCSGTGKQVDKVYNGVPISYIKDYKGNPVNCMKCNGTGKITIETGEIEKIKEEQYSDWKLKGFNLENDIIIISFNCSKKIFDLEKRGGHLMNSTVIEDTELYFNVLLNKKGDILSTNNDKIITQTKKFFK